MLLQNIKNNFRIKNSFFIFMSAFFIYSNCFARVFGQDDRFEIYQYPKINQKIGPSVAIMLSPVFLNKKTDGYEMNFSNISDSTEVALCKGQKFYGQPTASVSCSGFLVAPDIMMTAAHCVTRINSEVRNSVTPQCSDFMWVFDFKYKNQKLLDTFFPNENVAYCKEIIYAKYDHVKLNANMPKPIYGEDIALVKLDRKMNRPYLTFGNDLNLKKGDKVYTVGYPDGLPQKVTLNGTVKSNEAENYFTSTLDIFGGNSGGPVLNSNDEVMGVVVRSIPYSDYRYLEDKECSVVQRCSQNLLGCQLSDQQKIEDLYSHTQKVSDDVFSMIKASSSF